jgi:disulfide oxidoreductase YuzD
VILFFAICFSCINKKESYVDFLNKKLETHYSLYTDKYEYIAIMPRNGCNSCIRESESFFKEKKADSRYLFIFTQVVSKKELEIAVGKESLKLENVLIDRANIFYLAEQADSQYPLLLKKEPTGKYSYTKLVEF